MKGAQQRVSATQQSDAPTVPSLRVHTLGGFAVWRGPELVPSQAWARRKVVALFTYLLSAPGYRRHREEIVDTLWPGATPEAGANNMRVTLHRLRDVLDGPGGRANYVRTEGDIVTLAPRAQSDLVPGAESEWLDAAAFARDAVMAVASHDLDSCRAARARYTGDYLPDALYDDWVESRREELGQQYLALLLHGARLSLERGDDQEAMDWLVAVLAREPCHEQAARRLMRLYARAGRRSEALRVYGALATALEADLGQQPERTTQGLAEAIREGRAGRSAAERQAETEAQPPSTAIARESRADPTTPPMTAPPTNLPAPVSSFIGRVREQQEIAGLLDRHRLVTLMGPGGAGKTRLALAVAGTLAPRYPHGVWLVELATLSGTTDPGAPLVGQMVATALGLGEEADRPVLATLTEYLATRSLLLVLDNCEHLVAACAILAAGLLRACPGLRILVSSRERLEVAGEVGYQVPSLAVPDPTRLPSVEALLDVEAVALFIERARERRPGFMLTTQNAPAVARICARLDGLPLAIELAAARMNVLQVEGIAARLDDRFRLLTGGPRNVEPRQQTLRATLDWSYDLLGEPERLLLRRLSVFAGSCTLAAAEAVCAGDGLEEWVIVDLLSALVNRSLVGLDELSGPEGHVGSARYRLLETVRQYGWERLVAAKEDGAVCERHLAWCLRLATKAEPALLGPEQAQWLEQLEAEYDNLRAALAGSMRGEEMTEAGAQLAAALWRYWEIRGRVGEGRRWLEAAGMSSSAAPAVRARALNGAGFLACMQGDYERAATLQATCLALRREQGDPRGIAQALYNLGLIMLNQADADRAVVLFEESLAVARNLGDRWGTFTLTNSLGYAARLQRDYHRARALHEESLALARDIGDVRAIAIASNNLGIVARDLGDYEGAQAWYEEALALHRRIDDTFNVAGSLANLAELAADMGDQGRASALYRESLALYWDLNGKPGVASCLEGLAGIASHGGQAVRCATLLGAAEKLRETIGAPLGPDEQASYDRIVAGVRCVLDEASYTAALSAGRAMDIEQAIAAATEIGS